MTWLKGKEPILALGLLLVGYMVATRLGFHFSDKVQASVDAALGMLFVVLMRQSVFSPDTVGRLTERKK